MTSGSPFRATRARFVRAAALAATLAAGAVPCAMAQPAWPAKSVRVIVPYPPGGGNDIIARTIADEFSRRLGQQFFVDNRGGGGTVIGAELAARAAPDGYTLLVVSQTTLAIVPSLKGKVPYHPVNDYEPVTLLATQPYLVVTHPALPVRTIRDLVALARAHPGKLLTATPTVGTGAFLTAHLFMSVTGTRIHVVPYKAIGTGITELLGGHLQLMFSTTSAVHPMVASGKLRAIAITADRRSPAAPEVPTVVEGGLKDFVTMQWNALLGPRGMPRAAVERLNAEWAAGIRSADLRERLVSQGYEPIASTPPQVTDMTRQELERFGRLIRSIGLKDE